MSPPYYIASKTIHAPFWRNNRSGGDNITSTWIDEAGEGESDSYSELSERCLEEIKKAEFLVLYCEEGEILKGALIEAGMALALGKEVRCVGDCDSLSRVFKEHPLWSKHPSVGAARLADPKRIYPEPNPAEHYDCVQVLCSTYNECGTVTEYKGTGNIHARVEMAREFAVEAKRP